MKMNFVLLDTNNGILLEKFKDLLDKLYNCKLLTENEVKVVQCENILLIYLIIYH